MPESEVLSSLRVAVVALALVATGCASLDELAVAQTERLEEGEFAPIVTALNGALAPPEARDQVLPQDQFPPMVMHVRRPSAAWQQAMAGLLAREGATHAILVSLGVSQYPKGREGVFGKKVVLGTGHEEPVRFLTAEDKLLWQLQGDRSAATVP